MRQKKIIFFRLDLKWPLITAFCLIPSIREWFSVSFASRSISTITIIGWSHSWIWIKNFSSSSCVITRSIQRWDSTTTIGNKGRSSDLSQIERSFNCWIKRRLENKDIGNVGNTAPQGPILVQCYKFTLFNLPKFSSSAVLTPPNGLIACSSLILLKNPSTKAFFRFYLLFN